MLRPAAPCSPRADGNLAALLCSDGQASCRHEHTSPLLCLCVHCSPGPGALPTPRQGPHTHSKATFSIPLLPKRPIKYNKLVNVTQRRQTHSRRQQTRGHHSGQGGGEGLGGRTGVEVYEVPNTMHKISLKDVLHNIGNSTSIF